MLEGRLEALRDGVFTSTPNEFDLLLTQVSALSRLVEDLRTLSLAEAGQLSLNRETVDLGRLTREVLAGSELQARGREVRFVLSADDKVYVTGDEVRLRQVVTNLVDNALAFSPPRGTIYASLSGNPDKVTLTVRDTGPGIRPKALAHVFDRFFQDDAARSVKGSGLGLAIVKSLVGAHGGHVSVRNHPGGGAEFCVTLPC